MLELMFAIYYKVAKS